MNLMLAVIVTCILVGLFATQFGNRQKLLIATLATTMTALYFFVARFV
jgi:hypothetical protein